MRSDNLIIRLEDTDIDSASRIIEFVNSNFDTNNSLNKTNPFIPTINGVGYMVESGISYNTEISKLLEQFINIYIRANTCPSIQNFYDWFKQNNSSIEINNIFENSLGIQKQTSVSQKKAIFFDTLKATYTKHGIKQTEYALEQVIYNNNYKGFSNGNSNIRYRDLLMQTITPDEIKNFIKEALENDIDINKNDINKFCFKLFENDLVFKLNDACNVTLNNYNIEQLISAIAKLLYENNPGMFSRFSKNKNDKTNYREIISQYDKNNILMSIVKHLSLKGISYDLENTDELIRTYALDIMNSQYTYMDNITKANK